MQHTRHQNNNQYDVLWLYMHKNWLNVHSRRFRCLIETMIFLTSIPLRKSRCLEPLPFYIHSSLCGVYWGGGGGGVKEYSIESHTSNDFGKNCLHILFTIIIDHRITKSFLLFWWQFWVSFFKSKRILKEPEGSEDYLPFLFFFFSFSC